MDEKESGPSDLSWRERRERLVQQALEDGDLGRLRELAALPGGFGSNELRKRVWPFLLGADRYYSSDSPDVESGSVHLISEQRKQDGEEKQQEAGLVPHREEEQVEKDTNRSFVLYPSGLQKGDKVAMQADLQGLIVGVLRKYPTISYFQGYHDIMSVLYLTYVPLRQRRARSGRTSEMAMRKVEDGGLSDEKMSGDLDDALAKQETRPKDTEEWRTLRQCAEVLSLCRVRDAMGAGMQPMMGYLKILKRVLVVADPEIAQFSSMISPVPTLPFFALSWILTLFSHDVDTLEPIQRMFDFLLSRNPISALYLAVAILVAKKPQMLRLVKDVGQEAMDDPSVLHPLFARLPPLLPDEPGEDVEPIKAEHVDSDDVAREYDDKNPYEPIPLSTIFNIADDLLARYPWDGPIIRGNEILGEASSVITYERESEDQWSLPKAESLVNGLVIQPGSDMLDEDEEDDQLPPVPTRRPRRSRLRLRMPKNKIGTIIAVGVVLVGVGVAVYGARSGGPRSDWASWWSAVVWDWATRSYPSAWSVRKTLASWTSTGKNALA